MRNILVISLILVGTSCGGADSERVDTIQGLVGDANAGQTIYAENCERCHLASGRGGDLGPSITGSSEKETIKITIQGDGTMPSFSSLDDQQIADCTAYVLSL